MTTTTTTTMENSDVANVAAVVIVASVVTVAFASTVLSGEIFYRVGRRWLATRVTTTPERRWDPDPPRVVFETDFVDTPGVSYDVTPDGQRLLVVKPAGPPVVQNQISLIVNWLGR